MSFAMLTMRVKPPTLARTGDVVVAAVAALATAIFSSMGSVLFHTRERRLEEGDGGYKCHLTGGRGGNKDVLR
jgi:hypothetical protein